MKLRIIQDPMFYLLRVETGVPQVFGRLRLSFSRGWVLRFTVRDSILGSYHLRVSSLTRWKTLLLLFRNSCSFIVNSTLIYLLSQSFLKVEETYHQGW